MSRWGDLGRRPGRYPVPGDQINHGIIQQSSAAFIRFRASSAWQHGGLIPVSIVLRDFAAHHLNREQPDGASTLWAYIESELSRAALDDYAPHLKKVLLEKGGVVLLDGLDEVPEADQKRERIRRVIQDFCSVFHRCRFVITSRTYAYQERDWRLNGFTEAVLKDFSARQIRLFVESWYNLIQVRRNLSPEDAKGRAILLSDAVIGSERLLDLAKRPLLLTLIASLHAWRGGSLPEKREELYADAVELLLDTWESQRLERRPDGTLIQIQPSLVEWLRSDRTKVRDLLNRLAFEAHAALELDATGTAGIQEERIVTELSTISANPDFRPIRLIEYLSQRAGILVQRAPGIYALPHRTFQEYLAACHLTDHGYPDELAELYLNEPLRWREVAILAAMKASRGTPAAGWMLIGLFCPDDPSEEESAVDVARHWGALLSGLVLLEAELLTEDQLRSQYRPLLVKSNVGYCTRAGKQTFRLVNDSKRRSSWTRSVTYEPNY